MDIPSVLTFRITSGSRTSVSGSLAGVYDQKAWMQYLPNLDGRFSAEGSILIKNFGQTQTAVVLMDLGKGRERFLLKQYRSRHFMDALLSTLRESKAARAWRMARKMQHAGISIAAPVAMVEEKQRRLLRCSYLVTAFVDNAVNLKAHVVEVGADFLEDGDLMRRLGFAIGNMHASRFIHGDLKWSNILVQDINGARAPIFIDLDHVSCRRGSSSIRRARDLARFMVDLRELALQPPLKEAFLSSYFDAVAIHGQLRDDFLHRTEKATARIVARHERRKSSLEMERNCAAN